jgi:hypothetical protein
MSWQTDLDKKETELKKEEKNVRTRINSGSDSRVVSDVRRVSIHTEEIANKVERRIKKVITVEAALSDLEALEKDTTINDTVKFLRAVKVLIKFLSTMRSNQLLTDEAKKKIAAEKEKRQAEKRTIK